MDAVQYALCDDELLSVEGAQEEVALEPHEDDPYLREELAQLAAATRDPFRDPLDDIAA